MLAFFSCKSSNLVSTSAENTEVKADSVLSKSKNQYSEETSVAWFFSSDSLMGFCPWLTLPLNSDSVPMASSSSKSALPQFGFISIKKQNMSNINSYDKKASSTVVNDNSKKTEKLVGYKINWFLSAVMAVIIFFFCQCVAKTKIIPKIFGGFKKMC